MSHSAPSPSDDNIIYPRTLAQRLKGVQANGEPPGEPPAGQTTSDVSFSGPRPGPWVSNMLLAVVIVVSLVPMAILGALFWQGVIRTPWSTNVVVGNDSRPPEAQQAPTAIPLSETLPPKQIVENLSAALTVPSTIEAEGGRETPFSITLNSADPPLRSIITIQGLPKGTTLSDGRPYGEAEWTVRPDEIGDLRLLLPKAASGHANLRIALVAADGTLIASAATQLNVAADPKTALILRPDETGRIAGLIAHGQKMIDVGYLAGARGYFKRAAEAGSADAALALGATYDPTFINDAGIKGIKADLAQARSWYERARELGSQVAQVRLGVLRHVPSGTAEPVPAPNE